MLRFEANRVPREASLQARLSPLCYAEVIARAASLGACDRQAKALEFGLEDGDTAPKGGAGRLYCFAVD